MGSGQPGFGIVVEVEPAGVEALADGVFPGSPDRGWRCPRGLGSGSGVEECPTVRIGECHAVVDVGVAGDPEPPLVMEAVVSRAQADQVPGVGRAVRRPVDDVVHLDESIVPAAGHPAAAVAMFDDAARPLGNDVL